MYRIKLVSLKNINIWPSYRPKLTSETSVCPYMGIRFSAIILPFFDQSSSNFVWLLKGPLSIDYTYKIAPKSYFFKMHPFWAENRRGHHGGAIWFLGYKPNQKVGSMGIPFGSTIISKSCFPKFQW